MTPAEARLRGVVRSAIQEYDRDAHQSWVESHVTSPGFPDLDVCSNGRVRQVELKVTKVGGEIVIRPTQYRWFKDRVRAGSNPLMWVAHEKWHIIVPGFMVWGLDNVNTLLDALCEIPNMMNLNKNMPAYQSDVKFHMFTNPVDAVRHIFEYIK